jgi:hypothetical protein
MKRIREAIYSLFELPPRQPVLVADNRKTVRAIPGVSPEK